MGFVMNRFGMLKELQDNIGREDAYALEFNKFVLNGILVHDPDDQELVDYMSNNFVRLAERTANHFLFITFIHSSNEWKESKYCRPAYGIDINALKVDSTLNEEDEKRTMNFLRNHFGLPPTGSFFMLAESLNSRTFHTVPVQADSIELQFQLLNDYCKEEYDGRVHSPGDFTSLLAKLQHAEDISLSRTFIEVALDFASITSYVLTPEANPELRSYLIEEQIKHATLVILRAKDKLLRYRNNDYEDYLFKLIECMEVVYKKIYKIRENEGEFAFPISEGERRRYDRLSQQLLNTFNYLNYAIKREDNEMDELDYSGLTLYLGKIIENEVNLSVGEAVRWAVDIEMPENYNKYCAERGEVIVRSRDQEVDLNHPMDTRTGDFRLRYPALRTLLHVYQNMQDNEIEIEQRNRGRLKNLNENTIEFLHEYCRNCRNQAAHVDNRSQETYKRAVKGFEDFKREHMNNLYNIKSSIPHNPD